MRCDPTYARFMYVSIRLLLQFLHDRDQKWNAKNAPRRLLKLIKAQDPSTAHKRPSPKESPFPLTSPCNPTTTAHRGADTARPKRLGVGAVAQYSTDQVTSASPLPTPISRPPRHPTVLSPGVVPPRPNSQLPRGKGQSCVRARVRK